MGYDTDFEGSFQFDTPLTADQVAYIQKFSKTRRMVRDSVIVSKLPDALRTAVGLPVGEEGEYYVGDDCGNGYSSILNSCYYPKNQPELWCKWTVSNDGTTFKWNNGDKFYCYMEWLEYMIEHFFNPWNKKMSGTITWQGEDEEDVGSIIVITIDGDEIGYRNLSAMRKKMMSVFKK